MYFKRFLFLVHTVMRIHHIIDQEYIWESGLQLNWHGASTLLIRWGLPLYSFGATKSMIFGVQKCWISLNYFHEIFVVSLNEIKLWRFRTLLSTPGYHRKTRFSTYISATETLFRRRDLVGSRCPALCALSFRNKFDTMMTFKKIRIATLWKSPKF